MDDPTALAQAFLQSLYGDSGGADDRLVLWAPPQQTVLHRSIQEAASDVTVRAASANWYYGVCLQSATRLEELQKLKNQQRKEDGKTGKAGRVRGSQDTVSKMPGLWLDIDIAGEGHTQTSLPESLNDATSIIEGMPAPPSIIVHTGGGLHAYWLFGEPFEFGDDEGERAHSIDRLYTINRAWNQHARDIAQESGMRIDSTFDLARVLRIPGTRNHKGQIQGPDGAPGRPVTILEQSDARYEPMQIQELMEERGAFEPRDLVDAAALRGSTSPPVVTPLPKGQGAKVIAGPGAKGRPSRIKQAEEMLGCKIEDIPEPNPDILQALIDLVSGFREVWECRDKLSSQSERDLSIVSYALKRQIRPQDAWSLVQAHRDMYSNEPQKAVRADYIVYTLRRAQLAPERAALEKDKVDAIDEYSQIVTSQSARARAAAEAESDDVPRGTLKTRREADPEGVASNPSPQDGMIHPAQVDEIRRTGQPGAPIAPAAQVVEPETAERSTGEEVFHAALEGSTAPQAALVPAEKVAAPVDLKAGPIEPTAAERTQLVQIVGKMLGVQVTAIFRLERYPKPSYVIETPHGSISIPGIELLSNKQAFLNAYMAHCNHVPPTMPDKKEWLKFVDSVLRGATPQALGDAANPLSLVACWLGVLSSYSEANQSAEYMQDGATTEEMHRELLATDIPHFYAGDCYLPFQSLSKAAKLLGSIFQFAEMQDILLKAGLVRQRLRVNDEGGKVRRVRVWKAEAGTLSKMEKL